MTRKEQIEQAAEEYVADYHDGVQAFIAEVAFHLGAEWADAHPNWISVEEELPPIREIGRSDIVLVCTAEEKIGIAYYNHVNKVWVSSATRNVTHWMPVPRPPVVSKTENTGCPDCVMVAWPPCDKGIPCCKCEDECNSRQPCRQRGGEK